MSRSCARQEPPSWFYNMLWSRHKNYRNYTTHIPKMVWKFLPLGWATNNTIQNCSWGGTRNLASLFQNQNLSWQRLNAALPWALLLLQASVRWETSESSFSSVSESCKEGGPIISSVSRWANSGCLCSCSTFPSASWLGPAVPCRDFKKATKRGSDNNEDVI